VNHDRAATGFRLTSSVASLLGIVLTIVSVGGCSGADSTTESTMRAADYMPLQVGNEWVYRFEAGDDVTSQRVSITSTRQHDGQTWYVQNTSLTNRPGVDTMLVRVDGTRLWAYRPATDQILLLCDFGRTSPVDSDDDIHYVKESGRRVTISGRTFDSCIVTASALADAPVTTYARGIGPIESYWFRGRKQLVRATVNGDEILK
jgi:hypothetical protein